MTHRLLSHCDSEMTLKKMDFTLAGSGKHIPDYNIKSTQVETKQIEPFKIKDFIPQINPTIKGELSRLNKNSFLDFLLIQKAGKSGDQKFFDQLIQQYCINCLEFIYTTLIHLKKLQRCKTINNNKFNIFKNEMKEKNKLHYKLSNFINICNTKEVAQ